MAPLAQKIWTYLQPHVGTILIAVCCFALGAYLFNKREAVLSSERDSYMQKIKAMRDDYDASVKAIEAASAEERRQHQENMKTWQQTMTDANAQYQSALSEITKKKTEQTRKLIEVYGEDPTGMAEQVSKVTGFKVVSAEEVK